MMLQDTKLDIMNLVIDSFSAMIVSSETAFVSWGQPHRIHKNAMNLCLTYMITAVKKANKG